MSAYGASHHAWVPPPPPFKSGADLNNSLFCKNANLKFISSVLSYSHFSHVDFLYGVTSFNCGWSNSNMFLSMVMWWNCIREEMTHKWIEEMLLLREAVLTEQTQMKQAMVKTQLWSYTTAIVITGCRKSIPIQKTQNAPSLQIRFSLKLSFSVFFFLFLEEIFDDFFLYLYIAHHSSNIWTNSGENIIYLALKKFEITK